jgi:ribonuclease HII
MLLLGFDEAGRGSVLGPMVVGAYLLDADDADAVRTAGGRDSKGMTPAAREAAAILLKEMARGWEAVVLDAVTIDRGNLNRLEEDIFVEVTGRLRPDRVQIDAPVPPRGLERFQRRMAQAMSMPLDRLDVANQAEDRFPAVGAASIVAKTTRDAALQRLRDEHGELGSGYPSDPVTRRYLEGLLERGATLPDFVRTRWGTIKAMREALDQRRQGSLF